MSKTAKHGTYLVEFIDGIKFVTGNNYKPWWQHSLDYFYRVYREENRTSGRSLTFSKWEDIVKSVKYSDVPYVDDGGLKWATPDEYQKVIDEEAARQHQTFTPFKDIAFKASYRDKALLKKKFRSL